MDRRLYPIDEKTFSDWILPTIENSYIWKGRPPTISHYKVFCAILYILSTGAPWRDLPKFYGNWHSIYTRFQRGNERHLWLCFKTLGMVYLGSKRFACSFIDTVFAKNC